MSRHGATDWSEEGRHTGWTDLPLNDLGRSQAAALRPALSGRRFALVLTSTLERARTTCELAGFGDVAVADPDLREWHYGAYEGLTSAQIREKRPGWTIWDDGVVEGESIADVGARADRVIARIRDTEDDVLLFAHGHFLRILCARWLGKPPVLARHLMLSPAALSILGWEHEWPAVQQWNSPAAGATVAP